MIKIIFFVACILLTSCTQKKEEVVAEPGAKAVVIEETKSKLIFTDSDKAEIIKSLPIDEKVALLKSNSKQTKEAIIDLFISKLDEEMASGIDEILKTQSKESIFDEYTKEIIDELNNELDNPKYYDNIDYSKYDKIREFYQLLDSIGGDAPLMYRQQLYEIQTQGYFHDYSTNEDHQMSQDDYIYMATREIKRNYPDAKERTGEDWDYVNAKLNLNDFGDYKSAFLDSEDGFWSNSLSSGVFNTLEERKSAYEEFVSKETMKEKAQYLRSILEK